MLQNFGKAKIQFITLLENGTCFIAGISHH